MTLPRCCGPERHPTFVQSAHRWQVSSQNTAALPQVDRDAIAVYLKSLPARPTPNRSPDLPS